MTGTKLTEFYCRCLIFLKHTNVNTGSDIELIFAKYSGNQKIFEIVCRSALQTHE